MTLLAFACCLGLLTFASLSQPIKGPPEIILTSDRDYPNPYAAVEVYVDLQGPDHRSLRRPAFWDGDRTWRVRFAPTQAGRWTWKSTCSDPADSGLNGRSGSVIARRPKGRYSLLGRGLLKMSPGHRNVLHGDGGPMMLAGDTAWALPWRATPEAAEVYARDRSSKGFNACLLMTVQPDQDARGPRDRTVAGGFDVGFEDLPEGRLTRMNPEYFRRMDRLAAILLDQWIVPIYQPVFQGYGWKGLRTLGGAADTREYARYCRYLVARYGAQPAIWLVGADCSNQEASVEAGGKEVAEWDAYRQPIGLHYSPFDGDPALPEFRSGTPHHNKSHQGAGWLDFQWCQTGHHGSHNVTKVYQMHDNLPTKGVANGEPTYEGIAQPTNAAGWWQGNEAWSNLANGGTMGVFYGVAALWQWKLSPAEPGWPEWAQDGASWRTALDKEGGGYVGLVAKAFDGYDFADMTKHPELASGKPCVAIPGKLAVVYLESGGDVVLTGVGSGLPYRWFDPKTGAWLPGGKIRAGDTRLSAPSSGPWVLFIGRSRIRPANS